MVSWSGQLSPARKGPKTGRKVRFAAEPQVVTASRWQEEAWAKIARTGKSLAIYHDPETDGPVSHVRHVRRYLEPCGHQFPSFPRTSFPRTASVSCDDDGDV